MGEKRIVVDDGVIDQAVAYVDVQAVVDPIWCTPPGCD